jgi:serine/threonine protein kinase
MRFILAGLYLRSQTRGLAALRENTGIAETFGSVLTPIRAAVTRNNMALRVGARLGPYDIISVLGAGGFGEVYKARDTRLDRTVAIKILSSADTDLKARFTREAKAIAALTHPHICTLYDVGHDAGTDYLVMEYLEGETLAARLSRGPLTLNDA